MDSIDKVDRQILNVLQENAKTTHKEIAEKLFLTRTPVFDRIKKLERRGIIRKYVALLNPKKIDRGLTVLCFISLKVHGLKPVAEFQKEIQKNVKVMECYHLAGNFDFFLKVMVKDVEEYQSFALNDLSGINNISRVQSSFVLGELKVQYHFLL
jgi:DNA-binding Lrp family transcriptional regulator